MSDDKTGADARVKEARAELQDTLDAIEDKLNVPKRVGELSEKARSSYEDNPLPWIIGVASAAVAVAGIVAWAILSDD